MGLYRIDRANTIFRGRPGSLFRAADGPLLGAALRAGVVTRVDVPISVEDTEPGPELAPQEGSQAPELHERHEINGEPLEVDSGIEPTTEAGSADAEPEPPQKKKKG